MGINIEMKIYIAKDLKPWEEKKESGLYGE